MSSLPLSAVLGVGLVTGIVTLVGGTLALRFKSSLDLLVGFSSGAIIGVALFDLTPEALDLPAGSTARSASRPPWGWALHSILRCIERPSSSLRISGRHLHFAPAALTLHSFLDGLAIGLAFHVSTAAGLIVAIGSLGARCAGRREYSRREFFRRSSRVNRADLARRRCCGTIGGNSACERNHHSRIFARDYAGIVRRIFPLHRRERSAAA